MVIASKQRIIMARRGRSRHQSEATTAPPEQTGFKPLVYSDPPVEPLSSEQVQRLHDAAMTLLETIGIEFLNDEALEVFRRAGATVNEQNVRMDREQVLELIAHAPSSFTITPRNPARRISIGGKEAVFGLVASPPNTTDLDHGRRVGNVDDYRTFVKLSQMFDCIHFLGGYSVEPVDIHASIRHLDCLYDQFTMTDKVIHAYSLGPERVEDALEMGRIAAGLSHEDFEAEPRMFTNINSSSPLKHDWPMLDGAMRFARRAQPVIITPFTLSGAMAPVTIAGAIVQQVAEALIAVALLQLVRKGAPVVIGAFTTNVDMRSGAPAFGTPEYMRAMQMSGQMARFYKLPWRGSNACTANMPDAQAAWESVNSLNGVFTGHCNVIYHGAGWLEGGLQASFEKVIIDCELIHQAMAYNRPIETTDDALGLEAIREVGPNGHFLGCSQTQARYRTAFYEPMLADLRSYEAWYEDGAPLIHEKANRIWKEMISRYKAPPMDEAIREELQAFVEKRKSEGGAPTDF